MAAWMIPAVMAAASALINKDTADRANSDKQRERERQARMSKWAGFNNAFIPTGVESDVNPWTAALQGGLVGGLTGAGLPKGLFANNEIKPEISRGMNNLPKLQETQMGAPSMQAPQGMLGIGSLSQGFAKPQTSQNDIGILQALLSNKYGVNASKMEG